MKWELGLSTMTHVKSWLIGKNSDAGRDWGQEEKGTTEAGWHHWLDGRESEWTPGVGDGQGGLACCVSWGCEESDTTEQVNCSELNWWDQMPWFLFPECWALSQLFHSPLSLSSRGPFSSFSLSAIMVVSSAYLRLLIFLPAVLIPACASSAQRFSWCTLHIS